MASVRLFIEKKLKLRVNEEKSAVALVSERSFLGYRLFQRRDTGHCPEECSPF